MCPALTCLLLLHRPCSYGCEPNLSQIPASRPELQRQTTPMRGQEGDGGPNGSAAGAQGAQGGGAAGAGGGAPGQGGGVAPRVAARLRVRMLPYLTARMSQDYDFAKCNFRVRKSKQGAARVVVHRELGCAGAYTMEASLGGRSHGLRTHFSARDYLGLGETLCRAIAELAEVDDSALLEDMAARVALPQLAGA
jgi:cytosolic carboxypeptidase protein 1